MRLFRWRVVEDVARVGFRPAAATVRVIARGRTRSGAERLAREWRDKGYERVRAEEDPT